jgi:hypothetical protein
MDQPAELYTMKSGKVAQRAQQLSSYCDLPIAFFGKVTSVNRLISTMDQAGRWKGSARGICKAGHKPPWTARQATFKQRIGRMTRRTRTKTDCGAIPTPPTEAIRFTVMITRTTTRSAAIHFVLRTWLFRGLMSVT